MVPWTHLREPSSGRMLTTSDDLKSEFTSLFLKAPAKGFSQRTTTKVIYITSPTYIIYIIYCTSSKYIIDINYIFYIIYIVYIICIMYTVFFIQDLTEGSLEAKLPTIWTDGKAQPARSSDMEKVRREKIRDGESQKREAAGTRKGRERLYFSNVLWFRRVEKCAR